MAGANSTPRKQRTALPIQIIRDAIKRTAKDLAIDDGQQDSTKKLDPKTRNAMSNTIEKLCRIILINDRQGRPESKGKDRGTSKTIFED
jgi:hypothetical protein